MKNRKIKKKTSLRQKERSKYGMKDSKGRKKKNKDCVKKKSTHPRGHTFLHGKVTNFVIKIIFFYFQS